ncbi:CAZyme family AA7 [Paecilomyces variotii]|nr:CAZyme family AA7 [Paecilomyces variotii]
MDHLIQFLAQNPHIKYATPASSEFESLRLGYIFNETVIPAIIVRPRSAEDVSALVSLLASNELPFSIRVGGNDLFGRSQVHNAITIDLRDIAYIHVDDGARTARLGGGVLVADLVRELEYRGLVTPTGAIPSVGYVGWATHGGYGLLSAQYGLGADQILGARVVDCRGEIVDANEDMLMAIRGAGGLLGVIVEVTIKVYPLDKVLAGVILYESTDLPATIKHYNDQYRQMKSEGLPSALSLIQSFVNGPTGKALTILFVWASSDIDAGKEWLHKLQSWSPVALSTVAPTTMASFTLASETVVPKHAYGKMYTISVYQLTSEIVDVICKYASLHPNDPATFLGLHELRDCTPQLPATDTVVCARSPHFVFEIGALTTVPDMLDGAIQWGEAFYNAVLNSGSENIVPATYLPLTEPTKVDIKAIYGDKLEFLRDLKQRYDPRNVFKYALVQL